MTKVRSARRVSSFADSVFAEMTRLAKLHNAVNLSQGFPDFEAPQAIKDAACTAIQAEQNQYAPPYGTHALRDAIASDFTRRYGVRANSVAIGVVNAGMFPRLVRDGHLTQAWIDAARRNIALQRFGTEQEVADAVVFLASKRASYITGQRLLLDGGYSI